MIILFFKWDFLKYNKFDHYFLRFEYLHLYDGYTYGCSLRFDVLIGIIQITLLIYTFFPFQSRVFDNPSDDRLCILLQKFVSRQFCNLGFDYFHRLLQWPTSVTFMGPRNMMTFRDLCMWYRIKWIANKTEHICKCIHSGNILEIIKYGK